MQRLELAARRAATRVVLALLILCGAAAPAVAKCQLLQEAELHVVMDGNRPLVRTTINGHDGLLVVDTGSGFSTLWRSAADAMGLQPHSVSGLHVYGVGGEAAVSEVSIGRLTIDRFQVSAPEMLVLATPPGDRPDVVGAIGADFLSQWDVEFDFAHNAIRLFTPKDCKGDEILYWGGAYAEAPLLPSVGFSRRFAVQAFLGRVRTEATIDSGAFLSVATLETARQAGLAPSSQGVVKIGQGRGVGPHRAEIWTAVFPTFRLGEETIDNAHIQIADLFQYARREEVGTHIDRTIDDLPSMLLGADFLRSHRVMISNSQHMLYVSYIGGEPFGVIGRRLAASPAPTQPNPPRPPANGGATR